MGCTLKGGQSFGISYGYLMEGGLLEILRIVQGSYLGFSKLRDGLWENHESLRGY